LRQPFGKRLINTASSNTTADSFSSIANTFVICPIIAHLDVDLAQEYSYALALPLALKAVHHYLVLALECNYALALPLGPAVVHLHLYLSAFYFYYSLVSPLALKVVHLLGQLSGYFVRPVDAIAGVQGSLL
jgi:hypothetical protein